MDRDVKFLAYHFHWVIEETSGSGKQKRWSKAAWEGEDFAEDHLFDTDLEWEDWFDVQ